jgi:hypothetical protein
VGPKPPANALGDLFKPKPDASGETLRAPLDVPLITVNRLVGRFSKPHLIGTFPGAVDPVNSRQLDLQPGPLSIGPGLIAGSPGSISLQIEKGDLRADLLHQFILVHALMVQSFPQDQQDGTLDVTAFF